MRSPREPAAFTQVVGRVFLLAAALCAVLGARAIQGDARPASNRSGEPSQVRLSWTGDPRTTMTVMWQTDRPTPGAVVEYGPTQRLGARAPAVSPTYDDETGKLYEARIEGLEPGATYFYRVGSAGGGYSPVRRFRTAPSRIEDFTFTVFADHGLGQAARMNVARVARERPAFHLLPGDLSYANGRQTVWDQWFGLIEPLASTTPLMVTLGNHENERIGARRIGYAATLARTAMPGREQWYAFDYAGVRFVALNSDDYRNAEQRAWLTRTLADARKDASVRWLIVFMHHPFYSTTARRGDNGGLIREWLEVLQSGGVDLLLCGHNHNYERSHPLPVAPDAPARNGRTAQGEGLVQVISGGGGAGLYEFSDRRPLWCAARAKRWHYLQVRVPRDGPIEVRAIDTLTGATLDRFTIAPRHSGGPQGRMR